MVGRYALFHELASGGMATVHLGRLQASAGFSRTVAVKRLHAQHAKDPEFVAMFLDEARLAARINHPNVVATLDVVVEDEEIFLVMDYVHGESLGRLIRNTSAAGRQVPVPVAVSIAIGMLHGLHAAHEAKSEMGEPLHIVHRDMSPQNVIVGADGLARVLDFGVAKAANRAQTTQDGQLKGKLRYMSPEQLRSEQVTRSSDIFSAAIVAWELLTCLRFAKSDEPGAIITQLLSDETTRPSARRKELGPVADEILLRGLMRDPNARYATALEFAVALEQLGPAPLAEVSAWVKEAAAKGLAERDAMLRDTESRPPMSHGPPPPSNLQGPRSANEPGPVFDARGGNGSARELPRDGVASEMGFVQTRILPRPSQPISQLSSISVTASVAPPPGGRGKRLLLALAALVCLAAVGALGFALALRLRSPARAPASSVASTVPAPTTLAASPSGIAPTVVPSVPSGDPASDASPLASPASPLASPASPILDASPPRGPVGPRPPRRPSRPALPSGDPGDIILQR